ncbi:hypothetical protein RRG08_003985 [Elysia crispata]|uniref:Uncharacterized protein n=1 Tax=Elysia crispata TaxID=231223 RepID=A0AAE1CT29_9GAST|nr:hypothetical protein RRG08_003985 [Elysia crispata]
MLQRGVQARVVTKGGMGKRCKEKGIWVSLRQQLTLHVTQQEALSEICTSLACLESRPLSIWLWLIRSVLNQRVISSSDGDLAYRSG